MVTASENWRRSLTVSWGPHFARIQWDLHSTLGFWFFLFVLVWESRGSTLLSGMVRSAVSPHRLDPMAAAILAPRSPARILAYGS